METEYRKATAGTKVICRLCNKKFYPDKLRMHRCDSLINFLYIFDDVIGVELNGKSTE